MESRAWDFPRRAFARLVRDKGRALRWIQFTTVGVEIGLRAGLPDGVWVTNSGDVGQRVLASHAMALMLGVMRGLRRFELLRERREWGRHNMSSHIVDPDHSRMVILGMGHIGQEIARKAKAFDMDVTCVTRSSSPAVPEIDRVVPREKVDEVLPGADVVMVAMPLDNSTRGFLSAERIALMPKTAILVNISRGRVVDEAALARALAEGRIMGAGLDALAEEPPAASSPLWDLPNVLITPHVGGQGGQQLWRRMSELIRDNTRRYLSGAPLKHVVRTPDGTLQGY
jgi:phosphoglycerate dehydrogenase-like enzyme